MSHATKTSLIVLLAATVTACSEGGAGPLTVATEHHANTTTDEVVTTEDLADMQAEFGDQVSIDTTQIGASSGVYRDAFDTESRQVCRDHNDAVNLWWDGGSGLMRFVLPPPQRFRNYRDGTFLDRRRLLWRRAVFSNQRSVEATDPDGNVWRFQGRYNAICRMGQVQIGPLRVDAQIVVAQDPVDTPVRVRSAGGGCGGSGGGFGDYRLEEYDPYDPGSGGGTGWNVVPAGPSYDCGGTSTGSGGSGGADSGGAGGGMNCYDDYVVIEISYDGGLTWETYWEGVAKICPGSEE